MKNKLKSLVNLTQARSAKVPLVIIAFVAIIIFSMAGCPDGNDKGKSGTPTFTVTFDSNDGSKVDPQTVTKGGKATKPIDPTKSTLMAGLWDKDPPVVSYTFNEWQKDGAAYDFDTPVTANITLTAQWTKGAVPSETPLSTETGIPPSDYSGNSKAFTLVLEEDVVRGYGVQGVTLTITSAGTSERVISNGTENGIICVVGEDGKLVIDGNITLRGKNNNNKEDHGYPVVDVTEGGSLELKGNAKITGNTSYSSAVRVAGPVVAYDQPPPDKRASMTMSGNAEISGNTNTTGWTGGGVYLSMYADLTMNDNAAIKNNTASDDRTVEEDANVFAAGGGVFIDEGCTFTMNGGEISGNVAATPNTDNARGGGVYINGIDGKFIVASEAVKANIKGNTITYKGSGSDSHSSGPQVDFNKYGDESESTFTVGGVAASTF